MKPLNIRKRSRKPQEDMLPDHHQDHIPDDDTKEDPDRADEDDEEIQAIPLLSDATAPSDPSQEEKMGDLPKSKLMVDMIRFLFAGFPA